MANERISALIGSDAEHLTIEWMDAVRGDHRTRSGPGLSDQELRDHVPAILDEITEVLLDGIDPDPTNTTEARAQVYLRLQQGYPGRDLVREVSLLRVVILDHLAKRCSSLSVGWEEFSRAARVINLYMDEELRHAISVYLQTRKSPQPSE